MLKNYFTLCLLILFAPLSYGQLQPVNIKITDNIAKVGLNTSNAKRSIQKPTACSKDTIEYPRYKASSLVTITVGKGRSLGQLYSCPKSLSVTGFTFYAFVLPSFKTSKKMKIYCKLYKAGLDSLPRGKALRVDSMNIDSTLGGGVLTVIEKHAKWSSITLDSNYIITVETNDDTLTCGVVTNSYTSRDGARENLNCGSISGLWYSGRNLNIGGSPFDCDILLHPHVKYNFGTDFTIKNNCYNINDSIKFTNAAPYNLSGSKMYNRYLRYNLGYFCHLWDLGNFSGSQYTVDNKVKYSSKQNYQVRLISTIYGYKGSMQYGCSDTAIKTLSFKPDIPTFSGSVNVCKGDTAQFLAISSDPGVAFEWLAKPNSSTPFFTGKTYLKYPLIQNDTFYLRANNNGCMSGLRTIIIKVNDYPSYCNVVNDSICAGSKANLKALSDIGTIQWYTDQATPLPFYSGNVYQTTVLSNDTSFYVQAVNNGCALNPKKLVRALVGANFAPTAPIMSNDTTVCLASGNAIALRATVGSSLAVRWFDVASGGSSIQAGKIYYFLPTKREIKTLYADAFNGVCGSTRVPINVTVEDYPSISKILTDTICKGDSARVGFALDFGEANWYDAQTSGNLLHTGSQYTSAPTSSTDYYIETVSSVCVNPNRTKISTLVNTYPAIIKVWGDTICAKNPATLKSKFTGKGSMLWFDADTSTIALGSGNTFKTPTLNGGRKYFVRPAYAGCIGPISAVQPLVKPVPFSGFSFEVLTWQQVRVSPINSSGASVKWYFGDGTTSNNSNVTHRYANTGKYTIRLVMTSLSNGCKDSTLVEVQVDPSGIETQYNEAGLKLFPNPTQNNLHIESDMDLDGLNFKVYSLTGLLLMQNTFNAELLESGLNLSDLPVGLYLLSIQNHKPQVFVKQ